MNLICPHCQKTITVSDDLAGQTSRCPQCSGPFTVPVPPPANSGGGGYGAGFSGFSSSSSAAPPQVPLPPATSEPDPSPEPSTQVTGYGPKLVIPLHPLVVRWTPPACFLLCFVLFFFTWIATPLGGKYAWSQSGFGAAFGLATQSGTESVQAAALLILYFLVSLLAVIVGAALFVVTFVLPRIGQKLPSQLEPILQQKSLIVGGLSLLPLLFFLLQLLIGFPVEHHSFSEETHYVMHALLYRTVWLKLAFTLNLLAVLAALADFWLERRGSQPIPKLTIDW